MKKGDKVVYIGDMNFTRSVCIPNNVEVPDPKKTYTILSSDELIITLVGLSNKNHSGWRKVFWKKVDDEPFTNALTSELAHKTKWIEEVKHPREQEEHLNPRIFTTDEEF